VRLTITIRTGTRAGQRVLVAPAQSLRVGRTNKADIAITDDPTMSGVHFLIEYSGQAATVRDLESRNGLFVNGHQVMEAAVRSGDQIRAGRTFFAVSLESEADSLEPEGVAEPGEETRGHRASDATRAELPPWDWGVASAPPESGTMFVGGDLPLELPRENGRDLAFDEPGAVRPAAARGPVDQTDGDSHGEADSAHDDPPTLDASAYNKALHLRLSTEMQARLYAIVDGAIGRALVQEAKGENLRTENLLSSASSPYLAAVAPYLIDVQLDSEFLAAWQAMINKSPGILVESQADFDEVLTHLRSIFSRKDERGKQSFFRFYDPNLLYGWLSSCTPQQLTAFFGCLSAIIVGVDSGSRLLRLTLVGDVLNADEVFGP
jgi:hypothetical protein